MDLSDYVPGLPAHKAKPRKKLSKEAEKEAAKATQHKKEMEARLARQAQIIAMFEQRDAERLMQFEEEQQRKLEMAEEEAAAALRRKEPSPVAEVEADPNELPSANATHSHPSKPEKPPVQDKKKSKRQQEAELDELLLQFAARHAPTEDGGSKAIVSTKDTRKAKLKELQRSKEKAKEDKAGSEIEKMVKEAQQRKLRDQWKSLQDMFAGDQASKDPEQLRQHLEKIMLLDQITNPGRDAEKE